MPSALGGGGPLYRRVFVPRVPPCASPARASTHLRVLLVEDLPAARAFLTERLAGNDVEIVGPATDGAQAVTLVRMLRPDVCVVDVAGAAGVGLCALRDVAAVDPALEIIACATTSTGRVAIEAVRCGARRVVSTLRDLEAALQEHRRTDAAPDLAARPRPATAADEDGWVGFGGVGEQGRSRVQPDLTAAQEVVMARRLRRALDGSGFVAFADPVLEPAAVAAPGHVMVVGLMTDDGAITPAAEYMPAAHRFGLGVEIDLWTVREAARYAARGHTIHVDIADETVAAPSFASGVEAALMEARAPADRLVLRIRETTLAKNEKPVGTLVRRMEARGCRVDSRSTAYRGDGHGRVLLETLAGAACCATVPTSTGSAEERHETARTAEVGLG